MIGPTAISDVAWQACVQNSPRFTCLSCCAVATGRWPRRTRTDVHRRTRPEYDVLLTGRAACNDCAPPGPLRIPGDSTGYARYCLLVTTRADAIRRHCT